MTNQRHNPDLNVAKTGGLGNRHAPTGFQSKAPSVWFGGCIVSQQHIAVTTDLWLPNTIQLCLFSLPA